MRVLSGRATEFEQQIPFQILLETLQDQLGDAAGDRGAPAIDLLRHALPGSGPVPETDHADIDRFRLFQALRRFLSELAVEPLVVLLDDVHWADPGSIDFLAFLSRHEFGVPLLVTIAYRDRQAPSRLREAMTRGADLGVVRRLALTGISRAAAAALVGADTGDRAFDRMYRESGGNPLYLLTLRRRPELSSGDPRRRPVAVSGRLESLVLGEVAALPEPVAQVATAAAVLGDPFDIDRLIEVMGRPDDTVQRALAALLRNDLLRAASGGRLAFRHPVVRNAIYERADPIWRVAMHRSVLDTLTRRGAPATERARHIEQCVTAWDPDQAAVLRAAGDEAMGTSPLTAAHWYRVALHMVPTTAEFRQARFDLGYLLARSLGLGGRLAESRDLLVEVLRTTRDRPAAGRPAAVTCCAHMEQRLGRYPEAITLLRQEIDRAGEDATADRVELSVELGITALFAGDYPAGRAAVEWALATADAAGDELTVASACATRAFGEICTGRADVARAAADRAAALIDGLPDRALVDEHEALCMLGWAELLLERYTDADRHLRRGQAITDRTGYNHGLPHILTGQCLVSLLTGRLSEALERADQAADAAHLIGSDHLLGFALAVKSPALVWTARHGDGAATLACATTAHRLFAGSGPSGLWARTALMTLGAAELTNGRPAECIDLLRRAGGADLLHLGAGLVGMYSETLVTALLAAGDTAGAARRAHRVLRLTDRLGLTGQRAHAARAHGMVLAAAGDATGAAHRFADALRGFAEAGRPVEEARSGGALARALVSAGKEAEAVKALDTAIALAADCGARWVHQSLAARRKRLVSDDGARPQHPTTPDEHPIGLDLTTREAEVVALVRRGRSNKQIAGELQLSVRTVETHLAHVYRKAGVTSRTELAIATDAL